MRRRTYLTILGSSVLTALAGCSGDDTDDSEEVVDDGDTTGTDGGDGGDGGDDGDGDDASDADDGDGEAVQDDSGDGDEEYQIGDSFRTPTDMVVTPSNFRRTESYDYEDFDGEQTHEAGDGMEFAFLDLEVQNDADETQESPNSLDFEIIAGDSQFEPLGHSEYERDDRYEGLNDLTAGVSEDGVLPFEIPADVPDEDVGLFYSGFDIDSETEWEVIWQTP